MSALTAASTRTCSPLASRPAGRRPVADAARGPARRRTASQHRRRPAETARPALAVAAPSADYEAEVLPHRQELYAAALRLTRQPDDAKDLVQDTLLRAYLAWSRFEPGSNCRAWLLRILTNGFINTYRRRRRHTRFATECPDDAVAAVYGSAQRHAVDPARALVADTLGDEVSAALASLGDDYRQVVELADLRGVRYRDIAESLGIPIGTVMSRLFRARRQLEQKLEDYAAADYGIRPSTTRLRRSAQDDRGAGAARPNRSS
jgi:RNA polymerase sigma-70 factor, ECF subfamily